MAPHRAEALLCDPRRHLAALVFLAAENLQKGDFAAAFRFADRLCRIARPSARDFLLRSEASRRMGFADEARGDLARALERDPTDRAVLHVALNWGSAEQQRAAERLLEAEERELRASPRRPVELLPASAPGSSRQHPAALSVIVPVYEGYDATRACFEALFAQGQNQLLRIIAVDDASPNAPLRAWLDQQAAAGRIVLLRNESNRGFAASVNRALALCPSGDVILLNADALPPPGSLARLAEVTRSSPGIGTVTPLSNNGEYTSFPAPNIVNPFGSPAEIARLDRLAQKANGADFVDLPNGIGFCLYITRACLDAVGLLPEIYGRGYGEDIEFCLRAREQGFRNVSATGVYVGHAGGRSFGAEKRRLVMRNLALLERRFPDYRLESASFLDADPLHAARAAIEALSPVAGETVLLVCAEGVSHFLARERASELAGEGGDTPLVCAWAPGGRIALRGAAEQAPQSLGFDIDVPTGLRALSRYLRASGIVRIELFDPLALPLPLLRDLFRLGAPVDLAGGDPEWAVSPRTLFGGPCRTSDKASPPDEASPCPTCADSAFLAGDETEIPSQMRKLLAKARTIRPLDRMAESWARRMFGASCVAVEAAPDIVPTPLARHVPGVLAVILPLPDPQVDKLLVALGRALAKRDATARVVALGACVDDFAVMAAGNVFVAGAVETGEYERLLRQYEVSALMAPYRTRLFGWADRLSRRFALPQAFFDLSMGELPLGAGDLALDPRLCDAKAAAQIADWFCARVVGTPSP
jgi:GT2 family glycosyltransferase